MYKATHTEACTYTMYTHIYVLATQFINNWRTTQTRGVGAVEEIKGRVCAGEVFLQQQQQPVVLYTYKYIFDDSID
jgi:hypothetical protein